MNEAGSVR